MKSILMLTLLVIFNFCVNAQIEYPKFEIDSLGQKVVVMTIEQAQKLDNNSELLLLFENLNNQMLDYDSVCVRVINNNEKVIAAQKLEISKLKESLLVKDEKLKTLLFEIDDYKMKVLILEAQLANRGQLIEVKDKKINDLRLKMAVGGGLTGAAIIGLIIGLVLIK